MKKIFIIILLPVFIMCIILVNLVKPDKTSAAYISNKIIRFHVVANSDSNDDQSVKLKVRDAILKNSIKDSSKFKSRDEYLEYLKNQIPEIENKANSILSQYGKKYIAKAEIGEFNFPVKNYNSITLPAGKYEALNVILGNGDGKNWWCVMFPPLCFIDITRGLTSDETDNQLKKVMDQDTIESITVFENDDKNTQNINASLKPNITSTQNSNQKIEPTVQFKLKGVEIFDKIIHKIKSKIDTKQQ